MKFNQYFKEVQLFTGNIYVVSGYIDKDIARDMMEKQYGKTICGRDVRADYVRFSFPPDNVEDREDFDGPIWYTGATGKGSKPVWVFRAQ